jgi:Xylose isomerase-like TIM barrel.
MKLGIGTYSYAWSIGIPGYLPKKPMDAFSLIKAAQEHNVKLVQIADNLPLHVLTKSERYKIYQLATDSGIELEVGTRGIKPENLKQYLEIAQELHSSILRVIIDSSDHKPEPPEVVDILANFISEFKKADVALAIENHDRFKCRTLISILKALNTPYIGICLDTVNSYGAQESAEHVVEELGPYTINLHIKDYTIERIPSNMGLLVQGTPAGYGMLNVPWLLDQLVNKMDRKFNAILELWMPPEKNIDETILKEHDWVIQSMHYLRDIIPE